MLNGWIIQIYLAKLINYILQFSIVIVSIQSCTGRTGSHRERFVAQTESVTSTATTDTLKPTASKKMAASAEKTATKRSQKSQKSKQGPPKTTVMDSIRILKGKKDNKKERPLKSTMQNSDSQHTEVIRVPLGKAALPVEPKSKLAAQSELKSRETSSQPKRVTFADKLIKSKMTPNKT